MLRLILHLTLSTLAIRSVSGATVDYASQVSTLGDHIPDFSYCGYRSSNEPLPSINRVAAKTVSPSSGDQTVKIQTALDQLSKAGGGVLLLEAGNYTFNSSITIPSGTVLRGAGTTKTILRPKSAASAFITLGATVTAPVVTAITNITDSFVGVGATAFNVVSPGNLQVGQDIMVQRAVTALWVRENGMADLVRSGQPQTWLAEGTLVQQPRKITAISDKKVTIDIPLTDSLNVKYMKAQVATYTFPAASNEMGVESLGITLSPSCTGAIITDTSCNGNAIFISGYTTDSWIRNVNISGFNQFVNIQPGARRITVDSVVMNRDKATNNGAGYPADISLLGTQILVKGCSTYGDSSTTTFPVVLQNLTPGPNAVVDYYSQQASFDISPHQRWAHGLLVENSRASIEFANRGTAGTGQGWAINAGVAWNSNGSDIGVFSPPLGTNWCFGCRGTRIEGNGTFIHSSETVQPTSLFQAQLSARGV